MARVFTCPSCATKLSVPASSAGKKVRCPRCQDVFALNEDESATPLSVSTAVTAIPQERPATSASPALPPAEADLMDDDEERFASNRPRAREVDIRRRIPTAPEDILSPSEYRNYRNVRAVAVLFIVLGSIFLLASKAIFFPETQRPQDKQHPGLIALVMLIALSGLVGGIATLKKSRRWAPLAYIMGVFYLFAFPIGTILSVVLLTGLPKYLASVDLIRRTREASDGNDARD